MRVSAPKETTTQVVRKQTSNSACPTSFPKIRTGRRERNREIFPKPRQVSFDSLFQYRPTHTSQFIEVRERPHQPPLTQPHDWGKRLNHHAVPWFVRIRWPDDSRHQEEHPNTLPYGMSCTMRKPRLSNQYLASTLIRYDTWTNFGSVLQDPAQITRRSSRCPSWCVASPSREFLS